MAVVAPSIPLVGSTVTQFAVGSVVAMKGMFATRARNLDGDRGGRGCAGTGNIHPRWIGRDRRCRTDVEDDVDLLRDRSGTDRNLGRHDNVRFVLARAGTPLGETDAVKKLPVVPVWPVRVLSNSQDEALAGSMLMSYALLVLSVLVTETVCPLGTLPLKLAAKVSVLFPSLVVTFRRLPVPLTVKVTGMLSGVLPAPGLATAMLAV